MKILVVRFSSIGDIVLTSPVLRHLKAGNQHEVHFLTKSKFKSVVENNPNIDALFTIDASIGEIIAELRKEKYDLVIDLHNNLRTFSLKRKLGVKSHTFKKKNIAKWFLVKRWKTSAPISHVVDRYMETILPLGISNDQQGLDYFIPENDVVLEAELPESHRKGYIAWVIGGQYQGKRLSTEKLTELCSATPYPIVLVGGKEDRDNGDIITQTAGGHVYNACGVFNLNASASLVKQSRLVVAHDTGMMHVAAAFKKPIISLWGCTTPSLGMSPYSPGINSVNLGAEHLEKRPCSKLGNKCSYGDFRCTEEIDNTAILNAIEKAWD